MENDLSVSFLDLHTKYYEQILLYCNRKLPLYPDYAEECAQITFLVAYSNMKKLLNHDNQVGWFYRTASNFIHKAFYDIHKRNNMVVLDDCIMLSYNELKYEIIEEVELSDNMINELAARLITKLTQDNQELYHLFYRRKLGTREIAELMCISEVNCRVRLNRLRTLIRDLVKKEIELIENSNSPF